MESAELKIKVAIISDLHVGGGAKGRDFSLDDSPAAAVDNYLGQFEKFVSAGDIKADYLLIPGDISNSADQAEFKLASDLIQKIALALGVDKRKILFCPGNHDVDWKACSALASLSPSQAAIIKAKYFSLHTDRLLFNDNLSFANGRFDEDPYLVTWDFEDVLVCSLNTAVFDSPDKKPHHGEVKPEQLDKINSILQALPSSGKLKIFILHHHPRNYLDRTFSTPDFSAMTNAEGLTDMLSRHAFDFVIHGHKHIPRFTMSIPTPGHPLWILCAGSFSASLDNRYFEAIGNNFHLVEFHSRCSNKYARGVVNSWTHYSGAGWTPSRAKGSLDSQNFFGAYAPNNLLRNELKSALAPKLEVCEYIEWREFIGDQEAFRYYSNEMLRDALKFIQDELGVILHEIDDVNLGQLVILKRR
ncbi:metallophosphoesterase [Pseudomonas aeruginosa]|uniref:metallophosphoesterase family protein n=1 Tax=Pseudomonas aeruginosa TaxID=287 RepID=UPI00249E97F2|nr:metallophosphoesterase [Pseudomonas aeruginosa]MDI3746294.1 metallophosphoesterase [Pseudomonas aeruginosa]MDP5595957.1 metallophosphoesterase [Pseudomonas aeruginosa]HCF7181628.1 metallophosphoesterase [Pseudomonas aeruginosa]HCL3152019.1 metallophosphoesterase [Pseudomonas aeruginosa]